MVCTFVVLAEQQNEGHPDALDSWIICRQHNGQSNQRSSRGQKIHPLTERENSHPFKVQQNGNRQTNKQTKTKTNKKKQTNKNKNKQTKNKQKTSKRKQTKQNVLKKTHPIFQYLFLRKTNKQTKQTAHPVFQSFFLRSKKKQYRTPRVNKGTPNHHESRRKRKTKKRKALTRLCFLGGCV